MAGTGFTTNSTTTGKGSIAGAAGKKEGGKKPWTVIAYSADIITDKQTLRAAPSSGDQYLETLEIACEALATGETISVFDDADLQIGPLPTLGEISFDFRGDPLKFSGAIAMNCTTTHPTHVMATGFDS